MALTSGLFNSVNGDRRYRAEHFAAYFSTFIANGVFPNPSTGFQVTEGEGMRVVLKPGQAWINGYFITNDDDYSLTLDVADGVLKRIDRIVLRLDYYNRIITPLVKKGTFASTPVAPDITRDADAYELVLADILVTNGAIGIVQGNITDQRLNTELCGIVHGVVDQVDTTTIFNQYQSWFNNVKATNETEMDAWIIQQRAEFDNWFATVQNTLDGDTAGNLLNLIETHKVDNTHIRVGDTTPESQEPGGVWFQTGLGESSVGGGGDGSGSPENGVMIKNATVSDDAPTDTETIWLDT